MYGVGRSSTPELGTAPPDNNVQQTLETAQTDDMFGVMAPCWRLLERAKWYMDKVITALGRSMRLKKQPNYNKLSTFGPNNVLQKLLDAWDHLNPFHSEFFF